MRTGPLFIFLLVFLAACRNENRIPPGVLPQKKMQAVIWDMMRADQFLADFVLNKDSGLNKNAESIKYYQQVFAIHQVSKEQFQQSFSFYRSHPALFKMIMDSISTPPKATRAEIARPALARDSFQKAPGIVPVKDTAIPLKKKKRNL